jgi:hypothetical protein
MPIARCTRAYCLKLDFLHVNLRHPKLKWYNSCSWNGSYECFICYSFFCTRTAAFNFKNCEYKADTSTYQMEDTSQASKNYHCSCSSEFFSGSTSVNMSQMWYPNTVKWAQVLQAWNLSLTGDKMKILWQHQNISSFKNSGNCKRMEQGMLDIPAQYLTQSK